jgi:hypothetical protein
LLHNRQKWLHATRNLEVDDTVIVVNEKLPRGQWLLGRIIEVFPGGDGLVRTAKVKTTSGEFVRPITHLCPVDFTTKAERDK